MTGSLWWTPFVIAAGTLLLQGVIAWALLQVTRAEQARQGDELDRVRDRHHELANEMQHLSTMLTLLSREVERLRDGKNH